MAFSPKLYAVVSHPLKPAAAARKRTITEIQTEKLDEFKAKKAIDRASAVLDRLEARAAACAKQIARLQRRKACALAKAERLSDSIIAYMQRSHLDKADGWHVTFSLRDAPPALVVTDDSKIPPEYVREVLVSSVDKNAVKHALARGEEIEGCYLTSKVVLLRKGAKGA
jgi:hypothetical protein